MQRRVFFWAIFGALSLRAVFILVGSALIGAFWWLLIVFGVVLVCTGIRVIQHRADEHGEAPTRGLGLLRRVMPVTTELDGHRFITRVDGGQGGHPIAGRAGGDRDHRRDLCDGLSAGGPGRVPRTVLVFASNAFAILGLRAMYFLLAGARERFRYLSHALGGILVFVGAKMSISHWVHLNTSLSLAVIVLMLAAAVVLSVRRNRTSRPDTATKSH